MSEDKNEMTRAVLAMALAQLGGELSFTKEEFVAPDSPAYGAIELSIGDDVCHVTLRDANDTE